MSVPTVNVSIQVNDSRGQPVEGAHIVAKLTTTEKYNGFVVPVHMDTETDATGAAVLVLWPNELGTEGSEYRIRIINPATGKSDILYVTIPNEDCNLADVTDLPSYEKRSISIVMQAGIDQNSTNISTNTTAIQAETTNRENGDQAHADAQAAHKADTANPHDVTKTQVGLANVLDVEQLQAVEKGVADGVAPLDSTSKVPMVHIDEKALLAATARTMGGMAYPNLMGLSCPPSLEFTAYDYKDEANGAPPIATFARASTGTRVNAAGVIESVGVDELRHDYDPLTGEYKGWLVEESRTNLLTYSQEFNKAAWAKNYADIVANNAIAPDGTLTADKLVEDSSNAVHRCTQTQSYTSGQGYVATVYAEAGERGWIQIVLWDGVTVFRAYFDLESGAVGSSLHVDFVSIEQLAGGRWRCEVVFTATATGTGNLGIQLATGNGVNIYQGDGSSGANIWGAQLEAGAFPTSYIPTTTAQVTRAADVLSVATSGFAYNQSEGTLCVEYNLIDGQGTPICRVATLWDGTVSNRININARSSFSQLFVVDNALVQALPSISNLLPVAHQIASAWKVDDFGHAVDGVKVSSTVGTVPTVSTLLVGRFGESSLNGHIRYLTYFPRRLSDEQLQLLTT